MNRYLFYGGFVLFLSTYIAATIVVFTAPVHLTASIKIGVDILIISGALGLVAMLIGARKRAKL